MNFREILRFELAYQLRRPWTWLILAALTVFAFLMTRDGMLAEALQDDFFINSPFAIAKTTVACGLIWLLVAAGIAGEAAARDVATGMYPLTWTAPVSKAEYLGGRFLAVYAPGVDAALIGPFRPAATTDAMPGSDWAPLLGKYLGLSFVLTVFMALLMGAGIAAQALMGHHHFQIALYVKVLFGLQLPEYLLVQPHGFTTRGVSRAVAANGTYFTNADWFPAIGYQRSRELTNPSDRRAQGLPPRPLIASLYDREAPKDRDEPVTFEAVIGTDQDQVAVAPGLLRRTWTERGRRYFHYATDAPVDNELFFFSARYNVHEAAWKDTQRDVAIRIYYDPRHTANLERMVRGVRASLDYYTRQFGPYPYSQVTFVENAGDGDGAGIHAVSGMLIWEEGFTFWNPKDDPDSLDHPFAVIAHEMAHQWTVPYANVEGAPVMSESLAWYSAMKVVEHARGREQLQLLLRFMRNPHPHAPIRRGEPLLRGLDPDLFASAEKGHGELSAPSYLAKHRIRSGKQTITVTVPGKPVLAGIDPHHLLDWVEGGDDDNVAGVKVVR